jgi:hypothetical protein
VVFRWKERIEQRLGALESAQRLGGVAYVSAEAVATAVPGDASTSSALPDVAHIGPQSSITSTSADIGDIATLNLASNLGMFPAASVGAQTPRDTTSSHLDIISRGIITLDAANQCLAYFLEHLNPFLHGILSPQDTLTDIRGRSSLLTAAICTVTSFCSASNRYKACYDAFTSQISGMLFATHSSYNDVRALCIGAFWLDDISPTLSGLGEFTRDLTSCSALTHRPAVRIGTQLDLHRCITKMPHTKLACYYRTRLFYLVCLCDHHCSLKYGRPPMTQDWRSLKSPTTFLHSEFSAHLDLGLVGQLELWSTTRAVFEQFGADVESSAAAQKLDEVDKLSQVYQNWHNMWCIALGTGGAAGCIAELYYHCALLYLYSHIHRGSTQPVSPTSDTKIAELHLRFQQSAHAVLRVMVNGELHLLTLPSYFGTMLAFATVSLIKIIREGTIGESGKSDVLNLFLRLASRLKGISLPPYSNHPYAGISKGLEQATESLSVGAHQSLEIPDAMVFDESILADDLWNMDYTDFGSNWMGFDEH